MINYCGTYISNIPTVPEQFTAACFCGWELFQVKGAGEDIAELIIGGETDGKFIT